MYFKVSACPAVEGASGFLAGFDASFFGFDSSEVEGMLSIRDTRFSATNRTRGRRRAAYQAPRRVFLSETYQLFPEKPLSCMHPILPALVAYSGLARGRQMLPLTS
jgi:hypothetical protein